MGRFINNENSIFQKWAKKFIRDEAAQDAWVEVGRATGTTVINISPNWKQLNILVGMESKYTSFFVTESGTYNNGRFASNNGQIAIVVNGGAISLSQFYVGTTDKTSEATIIVKTRAI